MDEAQQLGLQARRQIADLVEEERAPFGNLDAAGLIAQRVREGALGVAEELAREELLSEGGAVHGDEGSIAPGALQMHGAREHALARAALAPEQHRHVRLRRAPHDFDDRAHGLRRGVEVGVGRLRLEALFQIGDAHGERTLDFYLLEQVADLRRREGFG